LPVVNSFLRPRKILSQFAEVRLPLIGEENRSPGVESLTISLAGRFERFDDIGNTLVARHGLAWKPAKGLSIRGSYSESFRPPGLVDRDESSNAEGIFSFREPQNGSVSQVLVWAGHNRDLREESAKTWTLGLELTDPDATGAAVSMTYFSTRFFDRLSQPQLSSDLLTNPAWNHLILRSWTPEYRADVCQRSPQSASAGDCLTTPVAAIADIRTRNDAIVVTRGVDLMGRRDWHTSRGAVSFVLNASYIFEFSEAETAGASLENRVSTPHYPIDLRGRGSIEWERGEFQGSADLNFQNGYRDTLSLPQRTVSPWKTLDLNFSYRAASGSLQGSTLSLHVQNAFNKMAPFVNNPVGIGYDQENGDLTGRTVSISVQKNW
jgi:outer membrane receptor protein involved in Fe transport